MYNASYLQAVSAIGRFVSIKLTMSSSIASTTHLSLPLTCEDKHNEAQSELILFECVNRHEESCFASWRTKQVQQRRVVKLSTRCKLLYVSRIEYTEVAWYTSSDEPSVAFADHLHFARKIHSCVERIQLWSPSRASNKQSPVRHNLLYVQVDEHILSAIGAAASNCVLSDILQILTITYSSSNALYLYSFHLQINFNDSLWMIPHNTSKKMSCIPHHRPLIVMLIANVGYEAKAKRTYIMYGDLLVRSIDSKVQIEVAS